MLHPGAPYRALTRLTRLAQRREDAVAWLVGALGGRLGKLAEAGTEVAVETGDPIGQVLAALLRHEGGEDLVGALAERIDASPQKLAVPLRELALVVVTRSLEIRRGRWTDPSPAQRAEMAELCLTRGLRLEDVGSLEEGLEVTREGVAALRRLVESEPGEYRDRLASGLHNLAIQLGEMGEHDEALSAAREAVAIYRELAAERPDLYRLDYAGALDNLGIELRETGQGDEALRAFQEAFEIVRSEPSDPLWYARMELNLGLMLWYAGKAEDALAHTRDALDVQRRHFEERPFVVGPDLARGLTNLSLILGGLGSLEESLEASREAVVLRRRLARERPSVFREELARSLVNHGMDLGQLGRSQEALAVTDEAVEIFRSSGRGLELAQALHNLGLLRCEAGDLARGVDGFLEAVTLFDEIESEKRGTCRPHLAESCASLGKILYHLDRMDEATAALERAAGLFRQLTLSSEGPESEGFALRLARVLDRLALSLCELGQEVEAVSVARDAVELYRCFAHDRLEDSGGDLAMALVNLAATLGEVGEPEEALELSREAVAIQRSLAEGSEDADPQLAGMLHSLGVRLAELGRFDEAVEATGEAVDLWRLLAAEEPESFQPLLADGLASLGAMLRELGRSEEALPASREPRSA